MLDHVVVYEILLLLLAVLPQGHAARAEIGEKLGPVAVELADLDLRNLIIDGAGGDLALFFSSPSWFVDSLTIRTLSMRFWMMSSCSASSFSLNSFSFRALCCRVAISV